MSQVQGVIGKVNARQFQGKNFYSFALNGQEGWYGAGMKRPPNEGTSVKFLSKKNSKGYLEVDGGIEIVTDGEAAPAGSAKSFRGTNGQRTSGGSGTNSSAYWDRKETRDIRNDELRELGATRNTALTLIELLLKNEAIKLPAAAKREEFMLELLEKYTKHLMDSNNKSKEQEDNSKSTDSEQEAKDPANSDDPEADGWN